jgi:cell filamentation protein, protein adenylyltransferase
MSDGSDPYLYPGTDVLRNVPGLRDPSQLAAFETINTARRTYELLTNPVSGGFGTAQLKAIHKQVFQDVFPWAGEFRTTLLGKTEHVGKLPIWFTPPHLLEHEAERIFKWLNRANLLRGLRRIEFARQAGRLLGEINKLHPFREGNGRTQRLFLDALARQAGHELHFDVVSRERMIQASIEANGGNLGMMTRLFDEITDAERVQPLGRAIAFLSREKFNWNDAYVATTTRGESYEGKLVGRDGEAFLMRSDDNRILIGRAGDIDPVARNGERITFRAAK